MEESGNGTSIQDRDGNLEGKAKTHKVGSLYQAFPFPSQA